MAESMKAAGFDDATVQGWIVDRPLPDWAIENPDHFDDDEEEEDDF